MDRPIIAVLAGGDSTRMGFDKAGAVIAGRTMLEHVIAATSRIGSPIVIGRDTAPDPTPAVRDGRIGARGPLTGLETALRLNPGRTIVLVAVDHPFVRPETLEHLLAVEGEAVVPVDDGWQQVTCAVYRPAFVEAATEVLDAGCRSIITALDRASVTLVDERTWSAWGEDGRSWYSVDSPDRITEGIRRYT
jgi:molybdopterin-guanine dinucleotide biosynthesis protein A